MRTSLVIPAAAAGCAAVGLAIGTPVASALALGGLGAAIAAAVRAIAGGSSAAAVAAGAAALLGVLGVLDGCGDVARTAIAGAAAMFAIAELARATASPVPAACAAIAAAVLDPAFVGLIAVAGVRLAAGPEPVARWTLAVPLVGIVAIGVAIVAAHADDALWALWTGRASVAARVPDPLGPITIVAAIAGLAWCAARGRFVAAAAIGVAIGVALVDLHGLASTGATPIVAAFGAGVGIAWLAALVRHPAGQAFLGATAGFVMLVAPAWTLASR